MIPQITSAEARIPEPVRAVLRGIGQVFFQENALTGICFLLGLAVSSPIMALGAVVGAAIGWATARLLKFDPGETSAGIFGFNSTLVGIATLFFFQPGVASIALLLVGSVVAALVTWLVRRYLPFPTYTAPFVVTTWIIFFLAPTMGAARVVFGDPVPGGPLQAVAHGVSQVMFQASLWTALLFLVGIALSNWSHAAWVLAGSVVGLLVGSYHASAAQQSLDPESLVSRALTDNIALGLYGYNATLAAVALFLWRRSLLPPILGALLAVLITELLPLVGLPALTAPFVLATWLVLALGWLDEKFLRPTAPPPA